MLSTNVIKSVDKAGHYFSQQDNYYTHEEGLEHSEWWGRSAEKLNLYGKVNGKQFTDFLQGKLPSGEQLGKVVEGAIKHRPGWDLTFSAPKSVSILALIGGDKRLIEAHREAVSEALSYVEKNCSQARIKSAGEIKHQNTNNLVASLFHHDLSRAKDPQLHTHSVVMNMTERSDGKWRSLASQIGKYGETAQGEVNGFIERVRHHNRFFSKVYEAELAYRVKQLGYEITTDTKSGIFEIKGVPKEVIQCFSKRRAEIETELAYKGLSGGKAAAIATLNTRDAKNEVDRVLLKEKWDQQISQLGIDLASLVKTKEDVDEIANKLTVDPDQGIIEAVKQIAKTLSVFKTTFTLEEVVTYLSDHAIRHHVPFKKIINAINTQIANQELISIENEQGKTVLMARSSLLEEKRLFAQLQQNKSIIPTVYDSKLMQILEKNKEINSDYHEPLKNIFGNDSIVLLEGENTKNELIKPIINIAKSAKLEIAILSPSLIGSKQFAQRVKASPKNIYEQIKALFIDSTPKHYSVMQFLSTANSVNKRPDVLIVDCAHLLSTHQKMKLAEWNHINQTKLILLGNKDTLLPQQRGVSLEQLMMHGIKPISIIEKSEINKTSFETKFIGIINKSVNNIIEVADKDNRHQAMVNHYGRLPEKNRKQTWIVADNKQSAEQLNIDSHAKLVENKILNKPVSLKILTPIFLTEEKSCLATSYKTNQKVRFNAAYVSIEIERGEYLQVVRHSKASNRVLLKKENGKQVIWRPDQIAGKLPGKIELFSEKSREFCTGESIIFNRSIKSKGITKGERFIVDHIDQKKIKFKNSHGKTVVLDLTKPFYRHIDYGYAATAHAIAHEKPTCLITDMPIKSFHTNQRKFYQIISQPKIAWIYTDNQQGLITQLEKKTGDRLAAHDIYAQSQETKKNIHNIFDILEKQIAKQKEGKSRFDITRQVVTAIEYAMHHLTEREAGFTHKQLLETAMCHSLGDVTEKMLTKATMAMEKANILRRGDKNDGTLWTTIDAVKVEREIIALCNQDKGKLVPIANDELIQKFCDPNKLKFEQITAIKAIVQSKDRIMAIQGYPGTGKTTMLATLQEVLAAKDMFKTEQYELLGLAPTNKAVRELKKRGIPAQTVDSFILQVQRARETGVLPRQQNLVLVVDETSMVSNRRALEILKISHELDCRLIPVGDERQLPSVESGKVHSLIQTQVDTKRLTAIQRQKTPILVEAVDNTIKYDFKKAFAVLKDSIIEINEKTLPLSKDLTESKNHERINAEIRKKRIDRLVVDFLSFPKKEWDNIQIITPGHDDRVLVNECLRTKLKESGVLKEGKDQFFNILAAKSFTNVERSRVTNFVIGDVLRFGKSEAVGIKAGEYLTIVGKEQESHLLILKNAAGQQLTWEIPAFSKSRLSHIEVFKSEARELQAGDKIRWSRTDKQNELFSTDAAMVTVAEKDNITVTLANQKSFTFDPSNPKYQHWDNGYAATVYAVQGDTKSIILAHLESYRKNLTSQPTFMVALTRAVNEFRLYTDNAEALLRAVEKNSGVKMSSLEVIGEYPVMNAYGVENKNKLQQKMIKPQLEDISFKETNPAQPFRKMQAIADSILVKEAPISAKDIQDFAQKINQESTMKWQKTNQCQRAELAKISTPQKEFDREI